MNITLPNVLHKKIIDYNIKNPERFIESNVQDCGKFTLNYAIVNKKFNSIVKEKLEELKEIYNLIKKYSKKNEAYKKYSSDKEKTTTLYPYLTKDFPNQPMFLPGGNPQLIDALSSQYTEEIEKDIYRIVELMPQSLHCNMGTFAHRSALGCLTLTFFNASMPVKIFKFLLEKGAPIQEYHLNSIGKSSSVMSLTDEIYLRNLYEVDQNARNSEIKELLNKI